VAGTASALDLQFSQTTGFYAPSATEQQLLGGGPPVAGRGGLDFTGAVLGAPGAPSGGTPAAPPNIWQRVAWGCLPNVPVSPANCANGGVIGNGFPAAAKPGLSAFLLQGQFGLIQEGLWTDISVFTHFNNEINALSNILDTVQIQSLLRLGPDPAPLVVPLPSQTVFFKETFNAAGQCTAVPAAGAPVNPLGSTCDDYAIVRGLDLTSIFIPKGTVGNPVDYNVDFRLFAEPNSGALVCDGSAAQPPACQRYAGPDIVIYTAESSTNQLKVQALLRPAAQRPIPLFVIGDVEPHALGNVVNFWGAQWWKNNIMSGFVSKGVASFKGYATNAQDFCGGQWESRPGNSSNPPDAIPDEVAIIVTDTVLKNGPNISGNIKEIVLVKQDGNYGPAPGHRGSGPVTKVLCTTAR
jgi:hypothetical protein